MTPLEAFPTIFAALYVGHVVGDHWVQSDSDAQGKGKPGREGRLHCLSHVVSLTITQLLALLAAWAVLDFDLSVSWIVAGLVVNAVTHYWADRRSTLAWLAGVVPGKAGFYRLGQPRAGRDDNPTLGTGAYALDQAWHVGWLFVAALISAGGAG